LPASSDSNRRLSIERVTASVPAAKSSLPPKTQRSLWRWRFRTSSP
jgi:hypothetical protein